MTALGDLAGLTREALGAGVRTGAVERLRGGSRKGVYRVHLEGAGAPSVLVYRWDEAEDFWPVTHAAVQGDPLAPVSGLAPFLTAHGTLDDAGVRVPRVLLADGSRRRHPADVAVVEDVTGGSLDTLLATGDPRAAAVLGELAAMLDVMHRHRAPQYGNVHALAHGALPPGVPCERRILDGALRDVAEAARRDRRIADAADALRDRLCALAEQVRPRAEHGLVHGELGPDHVLVDTAGHPVLIDIEGLSFFDVEWEHAYLRLRFGEHYPALARPGLDPHRLGLYALATHLSLVTGPLRLLDGDFPDREGMEAIVEHNLASALALLAAADRP